ncbi:DUF4382 domain-containing protein [Massilia agilis]|uniref:DUF4382 domain-containing protein n=1 Tax=Massilia agilis TaxID=1811226 RepID=A0ABT2DFS2_9BURK|nr:DUF4382 domain-containing protein [Massilia agilis]MCS0809993.1 DUF4382 domain-containing protein [Massilia agilis]
MKQQLTKIGLVAGSALAAASLVACGGGGGSSGSSTTPPPVGTAGTLTVALTDAPACGFDAVNVTVSKVRVNKSATASDTDAGWVDVTLNPARKIDLLKLTNGVLDTLGQTSLEAGHYTQVRLVLDSNASGTANTVLPTGSKTEQPLDTPSAVQSGIKLTGEFDVAVGQRSDIVIDFDACKSVLTKGNGKYALKPVLRMVPSAVNNGITGVIATTALANHVVVSAQQNGKIIASTAPDSTGAFNLSHLTAGNYDVVITSDNSAASVISAVPVTASGTTAISTTGAPIALALSTTGSISGTVTMTPPSATEAAYVAAKQSFASGPTVTIKYQGADLATGAYTLANLPVAAPQYAVYSSTLPLAFNAAVGVTPATYTVEASANGYTTKSVSGVSIATANQANVNFALAP